MDDFDHVDNLGLHDYIGEVEFLLRDVMCVPSRTITREFKNKNQKNSKKKLGSVEIRGNYFDVDGKKVYFHLAGKEFMKSHDLFIRVNCLSEGRRELVPVYGTNPEKNLKK